MGTIIGYKIKIIYRKLYQTLHIKLLSEYRNLIAFAPIRILVKRTY